MVVPKYPAKWLVAGVMYSQLARDHVLAAHEPACSAWPHD